MFAAITETHLNPCHDRVRGGRDCAGGEIAHHMTDREGGS